MENVEKEYEFTLEELNKVCLEAVNTTPVKNRKMVIFTSKLGYINFLEVLYSRKLTQIEKDNIPEEIYKI
ncbi:MAG: hypothetical protein GY775_19440 [Candidatus Scalindua sp.]|nr:hypothetical protein [Candidatus Scalindua sp.]